MLLICYVLDQGWLNRQNFFGSLARTVAVLLVPLAELPQLDPERFNNSCKTWPGMYRVVLPATDGGYLLMVDHAAFRHDH